MEETKKVEEQKKAKETKVNKEQIEQMLIVLQRQKRTYLYALDTAIKCNDTEIIEFSASALSTTIKTINLYATQLSSAQTENKE